MTIMLRCTHYKYVTTPHFAEQQPEQFLSPEKEDAGDTAVVATDDITTAAFALFSTPFAAASEAMNFDAVASLLSPKGDVARR